MASDSFKYSMYKLKKELDNQKLKKKLDNQKRCPQCGSFHVNQVNYYKYFDQETTDVYYCNDCCLYWGETKNG